MTCSERGLKTLTDAVLDLRAKVAGLEAKRDALQVDKVELKHLVETCRAELAAVPPPPSQTVQRVGYALGVVGGAMLATVPYSTSTDLRLAFGSFGLAAVGVGFGLLTW